MQNDLISKIPLQMPAISAVHRLILLHRGFATAMCTQQKSCIRESTPAGILAVWYLSGNSSAHFISMPPQNFLHRRSGAFGFFPLPLSWCANCRWVWPENWEMLQQEARLPSPTVYLTQHNSAPPDWIGWGTCQILSGLVATIQRKRRRGIDVPRVVSIDYSCHLRSVMI